ncbi:MAG: hypothetical protein AB1601_09885, partial [Planctomycetota bacterium]
MNRLVRAEPTLEQYSPPPDGARKVEFGHDCLGRRVLNCVRALAPNAEQRCRWVDQRVYDWVGPGPSDWATTPTVRRKFACDGTGGSSAG